MNTAELLGSLSFISNPSDKDLPDALAMFLSLNEYTEYVLSGSRPSNFTLRFSSADAACLNATTTAVPSLGLAISYASHEVSEARLSKSVADKIFAVIWLHLLVHRHIILHAENIGVPVRDFPIQDHGSAHARAE